MMRAETSRFGRADILLLSAAMVLFGALAVIASLSAHAETIAWNDTEISTNVTHTDSTIYIEGNLTVSQGGNLTLYNCAVTINGTFFRHIEIRSMHGGTVSLIGGQWAAIDATYFTFKVMGDLMVNGTQFGRNVGGIDVVGGVLQMVGVDFYSYGGYALNLSGGARVEATGCKLNAHDSTVIVTGGSRVLLKDCILAGYLPPILDNRWAGHAVVIEGVGTFVRLDDCELGKSNIARVTGGHLEVRDGTKLGYQPIGLESEDGDITLDGFNIDTMNVTDGVLRFVNGSTYKTGSVGGDCIVYSYGLAQPNATLANTVTVHHHYRIDFHLLDETRSPAADNSLVVETKDRVVVIDTLSDADGWVRDVWLLSWTRRGTTFAYEPPHRVQFGDVDYSITRVQVYANTTVTLWNSADQRDLVLLQDAVSVTDRSPREGDPFDVVIEGSVLIPYTYPNGTSALVLYVDGKESQVKQFSPTSRSDVTFKGLNLSEGLHEVRVIVDPSGLIPQLNRLGNDEARVMVEVASRNYTGDEIDLYVRIGRVEDTAGNAKLPLRPGVLDVHFTVRARYSMVVQRNVQVQLLVDGEVRGTRWVDLIRLVDVDGKREYSTDGSIPVNLPEGAYTIELDVDPGDDFIERYENNNVDSTSIQVAPKAITPPLDNWDDPALCIILGTVALVIALLALTRSRLSRHGRDVAPGSGAPPTGPMVRAGPAPEPPAPYDPLASSKPSHSPAPSIPPPSPAPPKGSREASPLAGAICPSCGGGDVVGYPDGSARCQGCKAVFYMR